MTATILIVASVLILWTVAGRLLRRNLQKRIDQELWRQEVVAKLRADVRRMNDNEAA